MSVLKKCMFLFMVFAPFICNGMEADDAYGSDTPLIVACAQENAAEIELLLKTKANVNLAGRYGRTPLYYAADSNIEIVKLLVNQKADVNKAGRLYNQTPLFRCKKVEIARFLIKNNANINHSDDFGHSILSCITDDRIEYGLFLIENGFLINTKTIQGTPDEELMFRQAQAAQQGTFKFLPLLRLFSKFEFNKLFYSNQF